MKFPFVDFQAVAPVPDELIERYRDRVEPETVEMWQEFGFGTAHKGFLKVIDPDEFLAKLGHVLPREDLIPVFATGMGDVIVWDGIGYVSMILRKGFPKGLGASAKNVSMFLGNRGLLDRFHEPVQLIQDTFEWSPYPQAVAEYGEPAYDECFGYVPLLVLGGPQRVENLQKVKLIEHIALITDFAGVIPYWR